MRSTNAMHPPSGTAARGLLHEAQEASVSCTVVGQDAGKASEAARATGTAKAPTLRAFRCSPPCNC